MKLTVERLPESQVLLDITPDEQEIKEATDKAYRQVSRTIRVPGFRPGKAPRHIIDRMYGPGVYMEEANRLVIDKLYKDAVEQESLQVVGQPSVDITEFEPLQFQITVPVFPVFELGDYTAIRVEPRDAAVEESEVDEVVDRMQKSQSPWVDVTDERTPHEGDQVTIDLAVKDGDEEFDKPVEGADFILGESNLFDQLREVIETMKVGETAQTEITFAEDDDAVNERVRGKTLSYNITLTAIKERQLREVNDEFAQEVGGYETVEALRNAIRNDLHSGKTGSQRNAVVSEIIDKIAEGTNIELPEAMIHDAIHQEMHATENRLQQQGISLEAYLRQQGWDDEKFHQELREPAIRRLRNSLILREVAEKEGIAVTDEDVDAEIDALTASSPNAEALRGLYARENYFREMLQNDLFDRKLQDRLIEIATEGRGAVTNGYVEAPAEESTEALAAEGESDAAETTPVEADVSTPAEQDVPSGAVPGTGEVECVAGYPIKGNASSKIYHLPGQSSYERTVPEMCFATEEDAVAAGYRASKSAMKAADDEA